MGRIYLVGDRAELDRRRPLVDRAVLTEVWQDLHTGDVVWLGPEAARRVAYGQPRVGAPGGLFWLGETTKRALDAVGDHPLPFVLAVDEAAVPVYYGPHLAHVESLPGEESLRARVLSGHGIGVVCVTYDQFGARNDYQPSAPTDPTFLLRRPGGGIAHRWRLFRTQREAVVYLAEYYGKDAEAQEWAERLPAGDFDALLARFGRTA
jgi:hypothetical protein